MQQGSDSAILSQYIDTVLPLKRLGTVILSVRSRLKCSHGCIYLIKNTVVEMLLQSVFILIYSFLFIIYYSASEIILIC